MVLVDAYKIPIEFSRCLWDFTNLSPIFLKLVIDLYTVIVDAYRIPIEPYWFLKMSIGFADISLIFVKLVINLYMVL